MKGRILFCGAVSLLLVVAFLYGCGRKAQEKDRVVATVNGEPVHVKDVNRALALNLKRDPMFKVTPQTLQDQVDVLVDKKLLIQEALDRKLDQTDRFVNTIKTFWEQTLIRDLMAHKDGEISGSVSVNNKEIKDYYGKLSHRKTFKVLRSKDKGLIERSAGMKPDSIEWDGTIGPISYGDTSSGLVMKAFDVSKGEMQVFEENGVYYLFYTSEDVEGPVAPFEERKEQIRQKISNAKKQAEFRNWLSGVRGKADVKVNKDILRGLSYSHE